MSSPRLRCLLALMVSASLVSCASVQTAAGAPPLRLSSEALLTQLSGLPTVAPGVTLGAGPATGSVRELPDGPAQLIEVSELAAALGLTGTPSMTWQGWELGSETGTLIVSTSSGEPWWFTSASRAYGDVTAEQALSAATSVLATFTTGAYVMSLDPLYVPGTGTGRAVFAAPLVDGRPTSGFDTVLTIDGAGALTDASGYLATPTIGASYPLLAAEAALQALGTSPSGQRVLGAEPGLALRPLRDGDLILIPAWLFTLASRPQPVSAIAVVPGSIEAPPVESTGPRINPPGRQPGGSYSIPVDPTPPPS